MFCGLETADVSEAKSRETSVVDGLQPYCFLRGTVNLVFYYKLSVKYKLVFSLIIS